MIPNKEGIDVVTALAKAGAISNESWSWSEDDAGALLEYVQGNQDEYKQYFLATDADGVPIWPVVKLVGGDPVVFVSAVEAVQAQAEEEKVAELVDATEIILKAAAELEESDKEDEDQEDDDVDKAGDTAKEESASAVEDPPEPPAGSGTSGKIPPSPTVQDPGERSEDIQRAFLAEEIDEDSVDWDERTVELAFSSELPVERSFGYEILGHDNPELINLERMSGKAPFLVNHNENDQVGVVERAWIDGKSKQGRAVVRLGRSKRASEILQDIKDRIRTTVSFGYMVDPASTPPFEERTIDGVPAYRFDKWTAFEISLASVPADPSVGIPVARSLNLNKHTEPIEVKVMSNENKTPDLNDVRTDAVKQEKERAAVIRQLGSLAGFTEDAERAVANDMSVESFRKLVDEKATSERKAVENANAEIGMNEREKQDYSFFRAMEGIAEGKRDGFEFEVSQEVERKMGRKAQGIYIPVDVLNNMSKRTTITTASEGDNLIQAVNPTGSYVDALRDRSVLMGVSQVLDGLTSDVKLPVLTTPAAIEYDAEDSAIAEDTTQDWSNVTLSPFQAAAYKPVTRATLQQAIPSIENAILGDFMKQIVLSMEAKALGGTGTTMPYGITNANYSTVTSGTIAGSLPTYAEAVDLLADVMASATPTDNIAYVLHPSTWAAMHAVGRGGTGSDIMSVDNGKIAGMPALYTSQMPTHDTTKTYAVCGNWDYCYFGLFGGVDAFADPYTEASSGNVVLRAFQLYDVKFAQPKAFAWKRGITI